MGLKGVIIFIIVILVLGVGYYLISPLFNTIVRDDALPGSSGDKVIGDSLDSMTPKEKKEFNDAVDKMKDDVMEKSDEMSGVVKVLGEGDFKPRAHSVEGVAKFVEVDGNTILRFENFETSNGPNLHIYLSSDTSDNDFVDLGKIKATKGNVNYDVPSNVDIEKYDTVLVWCVPFKVLFSYAEVK
jgi:hypothetical protein